MASWAILSDVHGNLEALEAVLRRVERARPDRIAVLGDTINYGPNPRECLELVARTADVILAGNHEKEAAVPEPDELESDGREMLEWTLSQLQGSETWAQLARVIVERGEASAQHREGTLHFVHASAAKPFVQYVWPGHPHHHLHLNPQLDRYLVEILEAFPHRHSFVGHTHTPALLTASENREIFPIAHDWNRRLTFIGPETIFYVPLGERRLDGLEHLKFVANPGSVGQLRDGNPAASWAFFDGDSLEFYREPYDHQTTAEKIARLPLSAETTRFFSSRLAKGE